MIALVTGGASGIGKAVAEKLADTMTVVIADRDVQKAEKTARVICGKGNLAFPYEVDVRNSTSVERLFLKVREQVGFVNVLFNNAGTSIAATVDSMTNQDWDDVFDTHVKGTYLITRTFIPDMCNLGKGSIVNMSSDYAAIGKAGGSSYAAAKTAILALTKSLALEFASFGIRVNAVGPGPIDTPLLRAGRDGNHWDQFVENRKSIIPLARIGIPEDVANVVAFLCNDRSSGINGEIIHVNGGRFMI